MGNSKPTISVIMSTYNGEKYLKEQLDSILRQEKVSVKLLVRDDGSADRTMEIVESYKEDDIKLIRGENKGPAMSFLTALQEAPDADYYAFADQDDYWQKDKLSSAVRMLEKSKGAAVYSSAYDITDEDLNVQQKNAGFLWEYTLRESLVYRAPLGCTIVMNKAMRDKVIRTLPRYTRMHDHWTILSAEALGADILIDKEAHILYRQHAQNVVGGGKQSFNKNQKIACLAQRAA